MIHRTEAAWQTPAWQQQLAGAFTRVESLFSYLDIDRALLPAARAASSEFGLRVPKGYADLMEKGNPQDPLLRQVIPLAAELQRRAGFVTDPVGDNGAIAAPGVLHKYSNRVLLITSGACGVNCRYCFRRHFPYTDSNAGRERWRPAIEYLKTAHQVSEVILSGGDPLTLSDRRLAYLVDALQGIPHLKRLRVHSRLPVVIPERVTGQLIEWLAGGRLQPSLVLHINHARELSQALHLALKRLRRADITLLNQSVLLRGVNDSADTLSELSESLFASGVLPYYLHLLDPVQGAAHFEVPEAEARQLQRQLRLRLPGYLLPRLVRDVPGVGAKTIID